MKTPTKLISFSNRPDIMAFGDVVKPTSWAFNTCLYLRRLPSKQIQATVYEDMEAGLLWFSS